MPTITIFEENDILPGSFDPPRLVRLGRDAAGKPVERELPIAEATMLEAAEYALRLRQYLRRVENNVAARISDCSARVTALANQAEFERAHGIDTWCGEMESVCASLLDGHEDAR